MLAVILSGILMGLSYNWPIFWFLSLFGFLPFFYLFYNKIFTQKQAFFYGWFLGFVFLGLALIWCWQSLPIDWIEIDSKTAGVFMVFITWFLPVSVLSFFVGLWSLACFKLKTNKFYDIFIFAFFWIVFEYLRMWAFVFLFLGRESLIEPHFSAGFLGYALAPNHNLLQLASLGSVYLLSFLVVLISGLIYRLLTKKRLIVFSVFLFVFLAVIFIPFRKTNEAESGLKIAVLNTYLPSYTVISDENFLKRFEIRRELIEGALAKEEELDVIILPEDSRFLKTLAGQEIEPNDFFKDKEVLVIDSGATGINGNMYSRVNYYDTKKGIVGSYDKNFLVPIGEYQPYVIKAVYKLFGQSKVLETLEKNRSYSKGFGLSTGEYKNLRWASAFCSELISPNLYKRFVKEEKADILINLSSQSRFHGSKVLFNQTINIAKTRAVENNRYLIQASNFIPSFVIDNRGQIVSISEWGQNSVLYLDF